MKFQKCFADYKASPDFPSTQGLNNNNTFFVFSEVNSSFNVNEITHITPETGDYELKAAADGVKPVSPLLSSGFVSSVSGGKKNPLAKSNSPAHGSSRL